MKDENKNTKPVVETVEVVEETDPRMEQPFINVYRIKTLFKENKSKIAKAAAFIGAGLIAGLAIAGKDDPDEDNALPEGEDFTAIEAAPITDGVEVSEIVTTTED